MQIMKEFMFSDITDILQKDKIVGIRLIDICPEMVGDAICPLVNTKSVITLTEEKNFMVIRLSNSSETRNISPSQGDRDGE